jgi:hypothetical protein
MSRIGGRRRSLWWPIDAAIAAYADWIQTQPQLLAALPELKGKTLGCWCKPQACHGDILARLADALPD